jgi:transposase
LLKQAFKGDEACRRIESIPGVGVLTATALVAAVGTAKEFKNGRQMAAFLGLVPRQHSSGEKQRLGSISKRGNTPVRTLLIHGARAVLRYAGTKTDARSRWLQALVACRGMNIAVVALANKMARTCWALLAKGESYRPMPA